MPWNNIPERPLEPPEDKRRVVYTCSCCGEPIYEGDEYWELCGSYYCEACIDDAHHYDAECEEEDC